MLWKDRYAAVAKAFRVEGLRKASYSSTAKGSSLCPSSMSNFFNKSLPEENGKLNIVQTNFFSRFFL